MIVSTLLDGAKVDTRIDDKFALASDQPSPYGEDTAPAPFDIFLAGIASCTAYYAQVYCRKWKLPHDGITVELQPTFSDKHLLTDVRMTVKVPAGFPAEHHQGLLRNAGNCLVKKTLEVPPTVSLDLAVAP